MGLLFKFFKRYLLLKEIITALYFYKLRLFFSILSVALGVGAIVLIVGAIDGANKRVNEIFEMFGPDAILLISGSERVMIRGRMNTLTLDDVKTIRNNVPGVYEVVPMNFMTTIVKYRNKKWSTRIIGTTPAYFSSWQWYPQQGTIFTERELRENKVVCVLGMKVKRELFPDSSPLGKYLLIKKLPVEVIGVLEERGGTLGRAHMDDRIIMPLSTIMRRILNEDRYITLMRIRTHADLKQTVENLRAVLRRNHKLGPLQEDDFHMFTSDEVRKFLQVISGSLLLFLGSNFG